MNILLLGVSCVGKSSTGKILAEKLGYAFYDMDEEIKKKHHITLEEFVNTGTLKQRDKKRGNLLRELLRKPKNKVIAVTSIAYKEYIDWIKYREDVFVVELTDSAENIYDRLVFSDENDVIYRDDAYRDERRDYYLQSIIDDQLFYAKTCYYLAKYRVDVNNDPQEIVAEKILQLYLSETNH